MREEKVGKALSETLSHSVFPLPFPLSFPLSSLELASQCAGITSLLVKLLFVSFSSTMRLVGSATPVQR